MLNGAGVQSLRLLLDDPRLDPDEVDWASLREVAAAAGVIVRLADALRPRLDMLPPMFAAEVAARCTRTQWALEIADGLSARCTALGIAHVLLRTAERYPDSGAITLLTTAPNTAAVDRAILQDLPARRRVKSGDRVAGITSYVTAYGIPLRIRHGRLGRCGEHARYARLLIDRAESRVVGPSMVRAPLPEDHLALLALERTYMRPAVHLDDLAWVIPAVRGPSFNWDYLFATAISIGMLDNVGAFLAYVNTMYRQLLAKSLLSSHLLARFSERAPRGAAPSPDAESFPGRRMMPRAFVRHLGATLESGRWQSALRLSLIPFIAAWSTWRPA